MEVILLERIGKLGQMGDTVRVKDGYARNYLLPKGKALRATAANKAKFDGMKVELETRNIELKGEADKVAKKVDGHNVSVLRQAAETGQLYGSVSARDISALLTTAGFNVDRSQVARLFVGVTESVPSPAFLVDREVELAAGTTELRCHIEHLPLPGGRYAVWAAVVDPDGRDVMPWRPITHIDVMGPLLPPGPGGVARAAPIMVDATWEIGR